MNIRDVKKVGVIGAGAMGAQIAMVSALAGYEVVLHDSDPESLNRAKESLGYFMDKRVDKGLHLKEEIEKAFESIHFTGSLNTMNDIDIAIEAIVEKLKEKKDLFAQLDLIAPKHTIFATNSSTIVSSKVAGATNRPDKVCNMHFFNPVIKVDVVELVRGPHTSEETVQLAYEFVKKIGKTPILLQKEISGFVANRILGKILEEALYLMENGYATAEEIDLVVTKALNHSIGPFRLMDFIGLDVSYDARVQRYIESGDERDKPSKLLESMVKKGEIGRKSGKGFYVYS